MLSSSSARAVPRTAVRIGGRRTVPRPSAARARFQHTGPSTGTAQSQLSSQLVAGLAGAGFTLTLAYGWYHFSGTKSAVDSFRTLSTSVVSAKDKAVESIPPPSEAIKYLKGVARSYTAIIPGASQYVDPAFDSLEELQRTHGQEVNAIVSKAYDEIRGIVKNGQMDMKTAIAVYDVLQRQGAELAELSKSAAKDLLDKHPEVKKKLGSSYEELEQLGEKIRDSETGDNVRKVYDDTVNQLQDLFKTGFSPETVTKAKDLVEKKVKEIKDLTSKAGREAWDAGLKDYSKYLDKAPEDVKKLLNDQDTITSIVSGSGATATVAAVWSKVKDISSSKAGFDEKSVKEFKEFVQQKVNDAKKVADEKGFGNWEEIWDSAQSYIKSVPGGEKALDAVPDIDMKSLSKVAMDKSDDAKQLTRETLQDLLKVLKDKSEKAKQLANSTKDEAKKSSH